MKNLKRKKGTLQASLTRIKNYVQEKEESINSQELETRLSLLESNFVQIMSIQNEIEEEDEEDDRRGVIEELYCEIKAKILCLMKNKSSITHTPIQIDSKEQGFKPQRNLSIRLPKMKLPQFNGEYTGWLDFYNTFKTLIHEDENLSDIEKFQYLKSCLGEGPLNVIKALEITSDNYKQSLNLLKERYDNICVIFQAHVKKLFELQGVNKGHPTQKRKLIDSINGHLRALNSLGKPEQIFDSIIIHLTCMKLDNERKFKWDEERNLNKIPSWENFCKFSNERCMALENRDLNHSHYPVTSNVSAPHKGYSRC